MKPPKSMKSIVHTLLGKKSKSSLQQPEGFQVDNTTPNASLDKNAKHHRSADDLLEKEQLGCNTNQVSHTSQVRKSRNLPRRSRSLLGVQPSRYRQQEGVHRRRVVSGSEHSDHPFDERMVEQGAELPRSAPRKSDSKFVNRHISPNRVTSDSGDMESSGAAMRRTTSWSHPQFEKNRTDFLRDVESRNRNSKRNVSRNENKNESIRSLTRFPSHENLFSRDLRTRLPMAASAKTSEDETNQKLRNCLQVLDRLSAQMKEIKSVSKRVKYVDTKLKSGNMDLKERERRLKELRMAEAASVHLKHLVKSGAEEILSIRHGSVSSGYDSENLDGYDCWHTSLSQQKDRQNRSRPSSRMAQSHKEPPPSQADSFAMYRDSYPYTQSASDMMPAWNSRDLSAHSRRFLGHRVTREDSASSGYATESEDGRQDSPKATDGDSVASLYPMQGGRPHFPRHQEASDAWSRQHFSHHPQQRYSGYAHEGYDPYVMYGRYPQHAAVLHGDIYGSAYSDAYGYSPASVSEHEIYSNGWYRLPMSHRPRVDHHPPKVPSAPSMPAPATATFNQDWSQISYAPQPLNAKYGGLSHLFYDPSAQTGATLEDNIAKQLAIENYEAQPSAWKTYGLRAVAAEPANRKRKTVRFSQTVRQRIETEESEVEDSTSVIKGGPLTEDTDDIPKNELNADDSAEIYMQPRPLRPGHVQNVGQGQETLMNQQTTRQEPIYDFPTGHIESSCMCSDCILARNSCQMRSAQAAYF